MALINVFGYAHKCLELQLLLKMSKYFHEDVRSPAMTALAHVSTSTCALYGHTSFKFIRCVRF